MTDKNPQNVRAMFASIAGRYDISNDVLSLGIHRYWQKKALKHLTPNPEGKCLDLCTGTGALLPDLAKKFGAVIGADFCPEMLELAKNRYPANIYPNLTLKVDDALSLSFPNDSFDVVTIAYGVRNFANLELGLKEVFRVLKPNGQVLILEFGKPSGWFAPIFRFYSKYLMPVIGKLLTGHASAYEYLPETAQQFPTGPSFQAILDRLGFINLIYQTYTMKVVNCYLAKK